MKPSYRLTTLCCIVGTFVQAIIANLTAILFVPMMGLYGFNFIHLGILVGVNFGAQVTADILLSGTIDKKGFRFFVLPACLLAFFGLVFFAAAPAAVSGPHFRGALLATVVFAFSSGMLEVLLSPIIDAIPGGDQGAGHEPDAFLLRLGTGDHHHPDDAVRVCRGQGELANHHAFMGRRCR